MNKEQAVAKVLEDLSKLTDNELHNEIMIMFHERDSLAQSHYDRELIQVLIESSYCFIDLLESILLKDNVIKKFNSALKYIDAVDSVNRYKSFN